MKIKYCLLLFLFFNVTFCQELLQGTVIDKNTREPLVFANLSVENNKGHILSDINGKFSFRYKNNVTKILCSYVGYRTKEVRVVSDKVWDIVVEMEPGDNKLDEIILNNGDEAANTIIRKVIRNKEKNNPENIKSFRYSSYNKIIYDFKSGTPDKTDSLKLRKKMRNSHFFMMESVTERKFVKPDLSKEVVIGTKVSGFNNPTFASIATDFQPFSFYEDNIKFFNINYLNPISNGSTKKYKFHIEDTLISDNDTVFIISFKPRKGKKFDGLKGLLYVNTKKYALQNVIATPFEKGKIDIKIQQKYTLIDGEFWFPAQLNFSVIFTEFPSKKTHAAIDGKSYISNVALNQPIDKKEFSFVTVQMDENASDKDSLFWKQHRPEQLNDTEKRTYHILDSIGKKNHFDTYLSTFEKFAKGKIPVGMMDIDLAKTIVYNKYEGLRIGSGLYTNEKLFKNLQLGAFLGYGLKDEAYKFGGEIRWQVSKENQFDFIVKYQNNLVETGDYGLSPLDENLFNYRKFIGYQYDQIKEFSVQANYRTHKYFFWEIKFSKTDSKPNYEYEFNDGFKSYTNYKNSVASINLRYAFNGKFINTLNQTLSMGTKYPIFQFSYSKGLKNIFDSDFNYNKLELAIEHSVFQKNIGKTTYRVELGYVDRPIPYGLLFTGKGSFEKDVVLIMKNTFQTMRPYEFLSDKCANLFFSQNFGGLLFKQPKFQPDLSVHNNIGWGVLSKDGSHQNIDFKTSEKLFLESGLELDNLLKSDCLNIANFGFGVAAYYRYGAYSYPKTMDNAAFKFTLTFSIK